MSIYTKVPRKAREIVHAKLFGDRRCRFHDLSKIPAEKAIPRSQIIQFYSSVDNIGNYLPILGIQRMLDHIPDVWCIHDKQIDFEFVNKNYSCAIIGGAGLLHQSFEGFWSKFARECKLPTIIWGVGVCLPDVSGVRTDLLDSTARAGVSKEVVAQVVRRCDLINVRDNLTANHYDLSDAQISACPTIIYVQEFKSLQSSSVNSVLYSSHEELVSDNDRCKLKRMIKNQIGGFKFTDNVQRSYIGLEDIIKNFYSKSSLVITTRLHGAITAYGMGIPYIAVMRDEKLRDFHRIHGNGLAIEDIDDLIDALKQFEGKGFQLKSAHISPVIEFGAQAKEWIESNCLGS